MASAPTTLETELGQLANTALGGSLLSEEEKADYRLWWENQIKYNIRLLEQFVIKCKAGATGDVSNFLDEVADSLAFIRNLFDVNLVSVGAPSSEAEGSNPCEPQPSQKKGPSPKRRQKRRQKKQKSQGEEGSSRKGPEAHNQALTRKNQQRYL